MGVRLLVWAFLTLVLRGETFAIRDVTVVDPARAEPQAHMTVVVRGERIVAAGPAATTAAPAGCRTIDGRGRFLIPGLWDMHVHLWHRRSQLAAYVANGVTGVRDMGSDFKQVIAWRREVMAGRAVGPHILTPGPPVSGRPSSEPKLPTLVAGEPEAARRAVDQLEDMGGDFIKVLSDLPRESYVALAERARQLQMDFAGHVPDSVSAWDAVEARQNSIEHLFGVFKAVAADPARAVATFDESRAREFFARCVLYRTAQVPTLTLWQRMTAGESDTPLARAQLALAGRMVSLMRDAGVEILAGTDTGDPFTTPGTTLHRELELLVGAGLTPMEALRTATTAPAKFLGWDGSVGRIEPGFVADLVLLDADPLADIRNVSRIEGVAARGRYLGRPAIAAILKASAAAVPY